MTGIDKHEATSIAVHPLNKRALLTPKTSAILVSASAGAVYGMVVGIIGGLSDPLVKDRYFADRSSSDQSLFSGLLSACVLLGAFIGCFVGVDIGNRIGHRRSLLIAGLLCVVSAVLTAAVPSYEAIVIFRTFLGGSVGLVTALAPWYVNDAVPADTRGTVGTVFQLFISGFVLVAQIINYAFFPGLSDTNLYLADWKWKLQFALVGVPGLVLLIISIVMHESPAFLALHSGPNGTRVPAGTAVPIAAKDGGVSVARAGGERGDIEAQVGVGGPEVAAAPPREASPTHEEVVENGGYAELFSRANIRWVCVGLVLACTNQLVGINAIIFYAPKIFIDADFSNPLVLTIAVVGVWNLVTVLISLVLVDRVGRRPLMLTALFLMILGTGLMSLAYVAFPDDKAPAAIIAILVFIGAYECGPGPLFFLMAVETFPARLRNPALSFTQACSWIAAIVVVFTFPVINDSIGAAATFLIFLCICAACMITIFFIVPEPQSAVAEKKKKKAEAAAAAAGDKPVAQNEIDEAVKHADLLASKHAANNGGNAKLAQYKSQEALTSASSNTTNDNFDGVATHPARKPTEVSLGRIEV